MTLQQRTISIARNMRHEGKPLREIADALGICIATASVWTRDVLRHKPAENPRKSAVLPLLGHMYSQGRSIPEISARTGVPASTLYDWRRQLGLVRNKRSTYVTEEMRERTRKQFSRDPFGESRTEVVRLYVEELATTPEIAKRFGVTFTTILAWLRASGVPIRRSPTLPTRRKLREANLGEKRWNWKGGVTPARVRLRNALDMKIAREACFKRDDFTCKSCRVRGGKLNAHHIWPFQRFPEWKYDVWNLVTLCKGCHDAFHKAAGGHVRVAIGPFFSIDREARESPAVYRVASKPFLSMPAICRFAA